MSQLFNARPKKLRNRWASGMSAMQESSGYARKGEGMISMAAWRRLRWGKGSPSQQDSSVGGHWRARTADRLLARWAQARQRLTETGTVLRSVLLQRRAIDTARFRFSLQALLAAMFCVTVLFACIGAGMRRFGPAITADILPLIVVLSCFAAASILIAEALLPKRDSSASRVVTMTFLIPILLFVLFALQL